MFSGSEFNVLVRFLQLHIVPPSQGSVVWRCGMSKSQPMISRSLQQGAGIHTKCLIWRPKWSVNPEGCICSWKKETLIYWLEPDIAFWQCLEVSLLPCLKYRNWNLEMLFKFPIIISDQSSGTDGIQTQMSAPKSIAVDCSPRAPSPPGALSS